jgi:hypothetical protein
VRLRLPPAFYDDHVSRDLPSGVEIRRTSRYVEIEAEDDDLAEIYSDASYYADPVGGPNWPEGVGIRASARATVKAMKAQGVRLFC